MITFKAIKHLTEIQSDNNWNLELTKEDQAKINQAIIEDLNDSDNVVYGTYQAFENSEWVGAWIELWHLLEHENKKEINEQIQKLTNTNDFPHQNHSHQNDALYKEEIRQLVEKMAETMSSLNTTKLEQAHITKVLRSAIAHYRQNRQGLPVFSS